jgi:LemA protein
VNLNNVRIAQFPDLIVASLFGFKAADLLEFTDEQTRDVDMKALFS